MPLSKAANFATLTASRLPERMIRMSARNPDTVKFKEEMRQSLRLESRNSRTLTVAKHANIYGAGDVLGKVYFIESGQIKLSMYSFGGKECLLAIHTVGDVF